MTSCFSLWNFHQRYIMCSGYVRTSPWHGPYCPGFLRQRDSLAHICRTSGNRRPWRRGPSSARATVSGTESCCGGQIQELGHSRNVDVGRAGLAVVAVHAPTSHIDGVSGAEDMGVAPLRRGNVIVFGGLQHLFHRVAAHNDHLDTVAVQAVLDALGDRHGHAKGGTLRLEQGPAPRGFITVMATPAASQAEYSFCRASSTTRPLFSMPLNSIRS